MVLILSVLQSTPVDKSNFDKVVKNYDACMNGTAIEASGLGGIPDIINQITTRFSVSNSDYTSNATLSAKDYDALAHTIAYLASIGVPVFGDFWIDYDNQNPVSYILSFIL